MDFQTSVALTSATSSQKPALWMSHLIASTHEGIVTLDPYKTSLHVAAPAGSTTWRAQEVLPPEKPEGNLFEVTFEPPGSLRFIEIMTLDKTCQMRAY